MRRALVLSPLLLALAGCAQATTSSTDRFKGDQQAVADVVEQLQRAGEKKDADKICSDILAPQLTASMRGQGGGCSDEIGRAIDDSGDFDLDVKSVRVAGTSATATVGRPDGSDKPGTTVMRLRRTNGAWRVTDLGTAR